jgi:hypothetical protein
MDDHIKRLPTPEASAFQGKGDSNSRHKTCRHCNEADFQAEANGRPFFRRKPIHHEPELALPMNVKPCLSKKVLA